MFLHCFSFLLFLVPCEIPPLFASNTHPFFVLSFVFLPSSHCSEGGNLFLDSLFFVFLLPESKPFLIQTMNCSDLLLPGGSDIMHDIQPAEPF